MANVYFDTKSFGKITTSTSVGSIQFTPTTAPAHRRSRQAARRPQPTRESSRPTSSMTSTTHRPRPDRSQTAEPGGFWGFPGAAGLERSDGVDATVFQKTCFSFNGGSTDLPVFPGSQIPPSSPPSFQRNRRRQRGIIIVVPPADGSIRLVARRSISYQKVELRREDGKRKSERMKKSTWNRIQTSPVATIYL